jgi:plasmid stabilization system protein ParE
MSRGSKAKYTTKQKNKARHIEDNYERRGVAPKEAAARAWATVNKQTGGGERSGGGRVTPAWKKAAARHDSARRANATRHGHSPNAARRARGV